MDYIDYNQYNMYICIDIKCLISMYNDDNDYEDNIDNTINTIIVEIIKFLNTYNHIIHIYVYFVINNNELQHQPSIDHLKNICLLRIRENLKISSKLSNNYLTLSYGSHNISGNYSLNIEHIVSIDSEIKIKYCLIIQPSLENKNENILKEYIQKSTVCRYIYTKSTCSY